MRLSVFRVDSEIVDPGGDGLGLKRRISAGHTLWQAHVLPQVKSPVISRGFALLTMEFLEDKFF
jgi:hypothetical protein